MCKDANTHRYGFVAIGAGGGGHVSEGADPSEGMMELNVVSLSFLLASIKLVIFVPVNSVPVNPVSVSVVGDVNQELPIKPRSTLVR